MTALYFTSREKGLPRYNIIIQPELVLPLFGAFVFVQKNFHVFAATKNNLVASQGCFAQQASCVCVSKREDSPKKNKKPNGELAKHVPNAGGLQNGQAIL